MPPPGISPNRPQIEPTPIGQRPSSRPPGALPPGIRPAPRAPDWNERASAAGGGALRGAVNSLPIVGGIVGALGGPELIPLGIGVGEVARRKVNEHILNDKLDIPTIEELPEELRPWAVGGEVLGGSVTTAGLPLAAAGSTGIRFLDRVIQGAKKRPLAYMISETAAGAGAGTGAGLMEAALPGNAAGQLAGGIVGGVLGSGTGIYAAAQGLSMVYNRAKQLFSRGAIENRAMDELRKLFDETGEDPAALVQALRAIAPNDPRTAAQAIDSPTLRLLEAELSSRSPEFARESAQQATDALEAMRRLAQHLTASGDPRALQEAARVREDYFRTLLETRLQMAEQRATQAAARLGENVTPATRADLGVRVRGLLDESLTSARAAEKELWAKIPGHAIAPRRALVAEATRIAKEELLPEEGLPPLARAFVARVSKRPTNVREMLLFRNRMLENAREAAAQSADKDARIYGQLAEAVLDDLEGTVGSEEARAFSRQLNDVFSRSFAGTAQQRAQTGASRIPPEVLLHRATAGPDELVNMRLSELERAIRFGSPEAAEEVLSIQQRLLETMASNIVDPTNGMVSPQRLNRFVRSNGLLLERFPEVREMLQNIDTANAYLQARRSTNTSAQRAISRDAAFTRIAGEENTVRAIDRTLRGMNPERDFRQLAGLSLRAGPEAVEGMQAAVLQQAFERAGGNSGQFSFSSFRDSLFNPVRPGSPSPIELMTRYRVMDQQTANNLRRLTQEAQRVETALATRPQLEHLLQDENALLDLALRVAGSKAGTLAGGTNTGSTLIAAAAGSRFARSIFNKIPLGRTQEVLIEAARNPQFMAALLTKPKNEIERFTLARKLNAWLYGLGMLHPDKGQPQDQGNGQPTGIQ